MMSIKNIPALMVLISFGCYHVIQGEVIYDEDIPRIDTTEIAGQWFVVASIWDDDKIFCYTIDIETQSADNFTMHIVTKRKEDNSDLLNEWSVKSTLYATMKNNTNVISTIYNDDVGPSMIFFDVNYSSHMALYTILKYPRELGDSRTFIIMSRDKTMSSKILEKVQKSNFYHLAPKRPLELQSINSSVCR